MSLPRARQCSGSLDTTRTATTDDSRRLIGRDFPARCVCVPAWRRLDGFIEATRHLFAGSHVAPRDPFCGLYAAPHVVSPGVCVAPDGAPFRYLGQPWGPGMAARSAGQPVLQPLRP